MYTIGVDLAKRSSQRAVMEVAAHPRFDCDLSAEQELALAGTRLGSAGGPCSGPGPDWGGS